VVASQECVVAEGVFIFNAKTIVLAAPLMMLGVLSGHAQQKALTLHEAVRIGLERSPESLISNDQVKVQRAQIGEARLRPNPRLYLQSEDLRPWASSFSFANNTEDYAYLGQTFEIDGKRRKRIAYANSGVRRSEAEQLLRTRRIAARIADAYWSASSARQEAADWQQQLVDFDRLVQYQSERVKDGATAGVDLLRTQLERDRVAISYAQAQRNAEAAEIELARQVGSPTLRDTQLVDSIEQEKNVQQQTLIDAIEMRPDVIAAREALNEVKADITLQDAMAVPNIDALGGYKRNSGADTLYAGLQIDLPLFNRNQGGIATAAADLRLAEDQLSFTRQTARAEIETSVSDYEREQSLVRATLPGMNDRAARNAEIIADAYRSGGSDLLRYLDAERTLIETSLLSVETWTAYQHAVVSLELAYGEQP
jgi:cobalt-zinc-cadmium efflux system outer membrane protein